LLPLFLLPRSAAADFFITSDGQPKATLVIAPQPSAYEEQALQELSSYIKQISGASLTIVRGEAHPAAGGPNLILIGRTAIESGHLRMPRREFTEDGFIVKVQEGSLLVAGATPRGTLFAAYRLLEEIGCRWFFPGELGEVVPQRRTIVVPDLDISSIPNFRYRSLNVGADDSTRQWAERNRMTADGALPEKSLEDLLPPEEFFAGHPEFYALVDGVRRPPHLCLSNPQVLEVAASRAVQFFRRNPQVESLLLFSPDPEGYCQDEGCRALGVGEVDPITGFPSVTDRALKFANALAVKVSQELPGKSFVFLAAGPTAPPPRRETVSDAVIPLISTSSFCPFHSPASRACPSATVLDYYLRRWCALSPQVRVLLEEPLPSVQELPFPRSRFIGETMRYLRDLGVAGVELTGEGGWTASGFDRYLTARLLWDAGQDVPSLTADFFNRFYGESADEVRAFNEAIELALAKIPLHHADAVSAPLVFNSETVAILSWHLHSANQMAVLADTKHHLELPNFLFRYLTAYLTMRERADTGKFVEAVRFADYAARILQEMAEGQGGFITSAGALDGFRARLTSDLAKSGEAGEAVFAILPTAKFRTDPQGLGEAEEWFRPEYDDSGWSTLSLAYPWELQGFEGYHGTGYYRVSFKVAQIVPGKKYILRFANLLGAPSLYLNGTFIGRNGNLSGQSAAKPVSLSGLEFEVTGLLVPGRNNLLTIKVQQPSSAGWSGPCGPVFIYSP
jgi:hypothetical protein